MADSTAPTTDLSPTPARVTVTPSDDSAALLARANAENKRLLDEALAKNNELVTARDNLAKQAAKEAEQAAIAAKAERDALNNFAIKTAVEKALGDAGLQNAKALGLLSTADLKVENGAVVGLDTRIAEFKANYPEFFRTTVGASAGGVKPPNTAPVPASLLSDPRGPALPPRPDPKDRLRPQPTEDMKQYKKIKEDFLREYRKSVGARR
jgi:hypothetical protein